MQNRRFVAPYQAAPEHRWSYVQLVPPNNRYNTPHHLRIWSQEVVRLLPLYGMTAQLDEDKSKDAREHYLNITDQEVQLPWRKTKPVSPPLSMR